jgi:hypothetical protein
MLSPHEKTHVIISLILHILIMCYVSIVGQSIHPLGILFGSLIVVAGAAEADPSVRKYAGFFGLGIGGACALLSLFTPTAMKVIGAVMLLHSSFLVVTSPTGISGVQLAVPVSQFINPCLALFFV